MSASASDANQTAAKGTQAFVTALVFNGAILAAEVALFLILRNKFKQIYEPRTFLPLPAKRTKEMPRGIFGFFPALLGTPARDIVDKNGLDAYMFVRWFGMMIKIFLPFTVLTWAVLGPIDSIKSGGGGTGIDMFTFGNVGPAQQTRYAAHVLCLWACTLWVLYVVRSELATFITLRQQWLISPGHAALAQSKTVLLTGVPGPFLSERRLLEMCHFLPGGVRRIWLVRDLQGLDKLWERRGKAVKTLEGAETKIMKAALKAHNKGGAKGDANGAEKADGLLERLVPAKKRPTRRAWPVLGKKSDAINWASDEIETTNRELHDNRKSLDEYKPQSGAFIQFNEQIAAHIFAQCVLHPEPLKMATKHIEVAPEDVIWSCLNINPYQQKIRSIISWAVTIATIVFWSIPVAFVGLVSNVSYLCIKAPWLRWLCKLPSPVNGIIQGILPPVALAVLFMLLPMFLRFLAKFEGIPLRSLIEQSLMTRYFMFLVIHGFLIVTVASGLTAALPQIAQNPGSAVSILAKQLPHASSFFLTYIVTTGFSGAAGSLLMIAKLVVYYVKLTLLGSTPRSVYGIKWAMGSVAWGTLWPNMSLLAVIAITYSIIAPIINGVALFVFVLFYGTYKYLFLWVLDMPPANETGGRFFPKSLTHIFVGLYIELLCLIGLFFLARGNSGGLPALGEAIASIALIAVVIFFHLMINSEYKDVLEYLPLGIADQIVANQAGDDPSKSPLSASRITGGSRSNGAAGRGPSMEKDPILASSPAGGSKDQLFPDHGQDVHAFDHPATYEDQKIAWLPQDPLGISKSQIAELGARGIQASDEGAIMNEKGKVDVSRSPPGEAWEEPQP